MGSPLWVLRYPGGCDAMANHLTRQRSNGVLPGLAVCPNRNAHWRQRGWVIAMMEPTASTTTSPRTVRQRAEAWAVLDALYRADHTDPRVAGARAAAEWTEGESAVSPITNERRPPTLVAAQWESHTAAMRELGIGVAPAAPTAAVFRRLYASGAAGWLFWWTGLEPLPFWLRRITPPDPAAS